MPLFLVKVGILMTFVTVYKYTFYVRTFYALRAHKSYSYTYSIKYIIPHAFINCFFINVRCKYSIYTINVILLTCIKKT